MSETKVKVRHLKKRACVINTMYGEVQLDAEGGVTNQSDLDCSTEDLLDLPNFMDAKLFAPRPEAGSVKQAREATEQTTAKKASSSAGPSDQEYGDFIAELISADAACTSEGYIQMDVLNAALREADMPTISGTRRKEISDAWTAAD